MDEKTKVKISGSVGVVCLLFALIAPLVENMINGFNLGYFIIEVLACANLFLLLTFGLILKYKLTHAGIWDTRPRSQVPQEPAQPAPAQP